VIAGKRHADQIDRCTIGGAVGAGVAPVDARGAAGARVPGTTMERVEEDTLLVRFDSDILFGTAGDPRLCRWGRYKRWRTSSWTTPGRR
jgi:hypothetical protein